MNDGTLYLMMNGYNHVMSNGVILLVPRGAVGSFPFGGLLTGPPLNVDALFLDAECDNDSAYVSGIYG
jgi:hypothetical protein